MPYLKYNYLSKYFEVILKLSITDVISLESYGIINSTLKGKFYRVERFFSILQYIFLIKEVILVWHNQTESYSKYFKSLKQQVFEF